MSRRPSCVWVGFERGSRARGVTPRLPEALEAEPLLALEECNGLTMLDFDRDPVRIVIWR